MAEPDKLDLKMALALGLDFTAEAAADFAGLGRGALYTRRDKNPDYYDEVQAIVQTLAEMTIEVRIGKLKAAQTAEQKIVSRLDGALKITDKIIAQLTSDDGSGFCPECKRITPESMEELLGAQKAITHWVSKFAASEAPKRSQLDVQILHGHVQLQDDTVTSIAELERHYRGVLAPPPLQLPPVPELSPPVDAVEAEVMTA